MQALVIIPLLLALAACAGENETGTGNIPTQPAAPTAPPAAIPSATGAAGSSANVAASPSAPTPSVTPTPAMVPAPGVAPSSVPPAATPPATMPASQAGQQPQTNPANNPAGGKPLAMDECGLKTKYPGDEYCILPPSADKGFQLHIGPKNYDNPEASYILAPGEENVVNLSAVSGNDKEVQYYYRQYRMRPGSHHVILTAGGQRIGGTQNLARDNPVNGVIPPENEGVGLTLPAKVTINANMHFYNFTEKPMVRELWTNYWYKEPGTVKETAKGAFSMTGVSAAVAHSHVVVGASCQVSGSGHLLTLAGHRHLNNVRFSVWHNSGGQKNLIMEDYDAEHPASLEFNSLTTNVKPDKASKTTGGASGIINIKAGDTLDFECEIINDTDKNFIGLNEASDDEMCILTGDTVGASISAGCSPLTARRITSAGAE